MKLYIARDKGGSLYAYDFKPIRKTTYWIYSDDTHKMYGLPKEWFPEVTWENSPQEVELKLIDNGK